jgi:hypothetical protein
MVALDNMVAVNIMDVMVAIDKMDVMVTIDEGGQGVKWLVGLGLKEISG